MASYLLLQDGGKLLLQDGGGILLSTAVDVASDPGRMTLAQAAPTATVTRAGLGTATVSRGGGTMTITRTT